jgi:FlaA1/EpsC-like NDP-sugar epimerase
MLGERYLIFEELNLRGQFATWLRSRESPTKNFIIVATDVIFLLISVFASYALRLSALSLPPTNKLMLYLVAPLLSVLCAAAFGVYKSASRNYSWHVERQVILSQVPVPVGWTILTLVLGQYGFARSVIIIYFIVSLFVMLTLRRLVAWLFSESSGQDIVPRGQRIKTLIYGAGTEGVSLADSLNRQGRYRPVAFIDTDYTLVGRSVAGLKVYSTEHLADTIHRLKPQEVMIAKPRQNRANRRTLVDMFMSEGLQVKTVPGIDEIVDGQIDVNALRPIRLEDLLGRDPVPPDKLLMERAISGQVVLVTGAGGSIGSELVRQISTYSPQKIILVDNNEFSLFEIHREIETKSISQNSYYELVPLLADVQDAARMSEIVSEHRITVILHAAAYKHVRMVQENSTAGIYNNVWGTKSVAEAAVKHNVKLFILISTDKAVRPTSVMGASKRVAEMVVQALAKRKNNNTVFAIVRFGNVLGSTGSVIPLFHEQIMKGGPVVVTHKDVTRFFMLIPEAAQLVIQSGALAEKGEVFVLDMGESVKIVNLAETMIELAGMTVKSPTRPDGDIEIKFIGLRDGEKLYEELQIGRDISTTSHERIMRSNEFFLPWPKLKTALDILENSNLKSDARIKELFRLALLDS